MSKGQDLGAYDDRLRGVQTRGGADYERFLIEELRPEIERRYPVDPERAVLDLAWVASSPAMFWYDTRKHSTPS